MRTNDDRQHLTQAQLRLAVTLFWGPCQQVLLPARLKELAKVVNGAKNRYSIHRNLPLLTKVCLLYPFHILGYAGSFFTSLTSNSRSISSERKRETKANVASLVRNALDNDPSPALWLHQS